MDDMTEPCKDFSVWPNGTSMMFWKDRNCDRCAKVGEIDHKTGESECEIETVLALSSIGPEAFSEGRASAVASRLKWDRETYLEHDCPEFEKGGTV
jgi:hypothetical protein